MQPDSLAAWLKWLEQSHAIEIDLGLERIRQVAERLQLLNPAARVITVAGTNGKGSCVAAVAALLRATGLHVGVYTSPHLLHYNERIAINEAFATDDEICAAFSAIAAACGDISLTYFEYGTLAALEVFRRRQVDVMVLEVGLGGRLDAVNMLAPDIAVITSIDLDHQDWLGHDREAIGAEKAGIVRPNRPLICADPEPPASILAAAKQTGAPYLGLNNAFGFTHTETGWRWWGQSPSGAPIELAGLPLPHLALPSLAAALQVAVLAGVHLADLEVNKIIGGLRLPGRFQSLDYEGVEVILDVAHNPAASAHLAQRLRATPCQGRTVALLAMMVDKDRLTSIQNLAPVIDAWYLVDISAIARAATTEQLTQDLHQLTLAPAGVGTIVECLAAARQTLTPQDRMLVCGSFFTVAAALAVLGPKVPSVPGSAAPSAWVQQRE